MAAMSSLAVSKRTQMLRTIAVTLTAWRLIVSLGYAAGGSTPSYDLFGLIPAGPCALLVHLLSAVALFLVAKPAPGRFRAFVVVSTSAFYIAASIYEGTFVVYTMTFLAALFAAALAEESSSAS